MYTCVCVRMLRLLLAPRFVLATTCASLSHVVVVLLVLSSESYNINIKLLYKYEVAASGRGC